MFKHIYARTVLGNCRNINLIYEYFLPFCEMLIRKNTFSDLTSPSLLKSFLSNFGNRLLQGIFVLTPCYQFKRTSHGLALFSGCLN